MSQLALSVAFIGASCAGFLLCGIRTARCPATVARVAVQMLGLLTLGAYLLLLWDRPILARLFPHANLIVLSNWLPMWGCFFVGCYVATENVHWMRRMLLSGLTLCLCIYSCIAPLLGETPDCSIQSRPGALVSQSTPYTCSAACAASLLRLHGVSATESELANLCLTREGTHWQGLYRGLMIKTELTEWTVEVEPFDPQTLQQKTSLPAIMCVNIDPSQFDGNVDHGFKAEVGHSVLYLGPAGSRTISVFDPAPDFGLESWGDRIMETITSGVLVRLVPRDPDNVAALHESRKTARHVAARRFTVGL